MNKDEAVYNGYTEIVPYTKEKIKVQVEDGEDEYGVYVIVIHNGIKSSKIRYQILNDELEYE